MPRKTRSRSNRRRRKSVSRRQRGGNASFEECAKYHDKDASCELKGCKIVEEQPMGDPLAKAIQQCRPKKLKNFWEGGRRRRSARKPRRKRRSSRKPKRKTRKSRRRQRGGAACKNFKNVADCDAYGVKTNDPGRCVWKVSSITRKPRCQVNLSKK